MIELGEISRAISSYRDECRDVETCPDLRKILRFFNEQMLVTGYADLN